MAFNAAGLAGKEHACASCDYGISGQIIFFCHKEAPVTFFLKKAAGIESASKEPGRSVAGKVTMAQVREIADAKMDDMNAVDLEGATQMEMGSARSMGLEVIEG